MERKYPVIFLSCSLLRPSRACACGESRNAAVSSAICFLLMDQSLAQRGPFLRSLRSCILRPMSDRAPSGPRGRRGSKWSWLLGALALLVVVLIARPVLHLLSNALDDQDNREELEVGHVDDASGLNATRVAEVWAIPTDADRAEEQLRLLLRRAKQQGLAISIAGARHTMGGHTITPDGVVIDMLPFNAMRLGESEGTLWVQAGARWSEVIPFLDRHDLSVAVMQSNNSFSVGGSLGANCHGWQHGRPPICDTVQSFRLMKADGSIVTCSRSQNRELFSLALGGYGLFGIILDAIMEVVPNERYRMHSQLIDCDQLGETFIELLKRPSVKMGYARLCVRNDQMFAQAIVNMLEDAPASDGALPKLDAPGLQELKRAVFRGSVAATTARSCAGQWRRPSASSLVESVSLEISS
ncbi:MAG TPA: FAD-binding oxidoreductase [Planctomycetes bacterium]|nr:FAD-binding oxidoreductase [Planctomycetota bacterium]